MLNEVVNCALQKKNNIHTCLDNHTHLCHICCRFDKTKEHFQKHNKILVSRLLAITQVSLAGLLRGLKLWRVYSIMVCRLVRHVC